MRKHVLAFVGLMMVASLGGCGRGLVGRSVLVSAPIGASVTSSASPQAVTVGQTATLSWTSANATAVQIDNGIGNVQSSGSIAVNPEQTTTYIITASGTGASSTATATVTVNKPFCGVGEGFRAQLGFRVPNIVISPFTRKHYVSHVPMDHTGIIKFVESRVIGPDAHLTERDKAQPDLPDFFDFPAVPWKTPPSPPIPASPSCNPGNL